MKSLFIGGELRSTFLRSITFLVVATCTSLSGENHCWCAVSMDYKVKLFHGYCGLVFFSLRTRRGKCYILSGCVISLK